MLVVSTTRSVLVSWFFHRFSIVFAERLKRLAQDVFFEVANQERDSVWIGPGLAAVVTGSQSVGIVCLIDKGAVGFNEFLYRRPETAG